MSGHSKNTAFSLLVPCHPFSSSFAVLVSAGYLSFCNKQLKVVAVAAVVVVVVVAVRLLVVVGAVGMAGMAGAPDMLELVGLVVVGGMAVVHMIGVVGRGW